MEKSKPKIGALAPWFGAKRTLAPRIVQQLGPHKAYFEPFCGSMAVLFAKPACRHEVVNDLNRDLVNVSHVLKTPALARELLARLHYTLAAEEAYRESMRIMRAPFAGDLGDDERAYHALVYWWLGRNGVAGKRKSTNGFAVRYSANGGSGAVRFRAMIQSIPGFMRRLERVDVLNKCGFEVIDKIHDAAGTAVYCDPPYVTKSDSYEHDFAREDHKRLADALSRFRHARVVVSYYPHPLLDDLYPADRWDRVKISVNKNIRNTDSRGPVKATELLLVNGPVLES